jgi:hypothetical protein
VRRHRPVWVFEQQTPILQMPRRRHVRQALRRVPSGLKGMQLFAVCLRTRAHRLSAHYHAGEMIAVQPVPHKPGLLEWFEL